MGSGLILTFPEIRLEEDEDCWYDFVQVLSGNLGLAGPPITPRMCREVDYQVRDCTAKFYVDFTDQHYLLSIISYHLLLINVCHIQYVQIDNL